MRRRKGEWKRQGQIAIAVGEDGEQEGEIQATRDGWLWRISKDGRFEAWEQGQERINVVRIDIQGVEMNPFVSHFFVDEKGSRYFLIGVNINQGWRIRIYPVVYQSRIGQIRFRQYIINSSLQSNEHATAVCYVRQNGGKMFVGTNHGRILESTQRIKVEPPRSTSRTSDQTITFDVIYPSTGSQSFNAYGPLSPSGTPSSATKLWNFFSKRKNEEKVLQMTYELDRRILIALTTESVLVMSFSPVILHVLSFYRGLLSFYRNEGLRHVR